MIFDIHPFKCVQCKGVRPHRLIKTYDCPDIPEAPGEVWLMECQGCFDHRIIYPTERVASKEDDIERCDECGNWKMISLNAGFAESQRIRKASRSNTSQGIRTSRRRFQLPIYEFKCPQCQIKVEQSFAVYSNNYLWCNDCQTPMEKQFTSPGIIFKGDGWGGSKK